MNIEMVEIPNTNFEIGKHPITQSQWIEIMGNNPSHFKNCLSCPVENVSWYDVQEFIKKLNQKTGLEYRLPTDDEWIYALGTWYESNDILNIAWCHENSEGKTHPIGEKLPNEYGLYDMLGNVWEWTNTEVNSHYVLRGGSWGTVLQNVRALGQASFASPEHSSTTGFRLAQTICLLDKTKAESEEKINCKDCADITCKKYYGTDSPAGKCFKPKLPFSNAKVGDKVYDLMYGEGGIKGVGTTGLSVGFKIFPGTIAYKFTGQTIQHQDINRTLYPAGTKVMIKEPQCSYRQEYRHDGGTYYKCSLYPNTDCEESYKQFYPYCGKNKITKGGEDVSD